MLWLWNGPLPFVPPEGKRTVIGQGVLRAPKLRPGVVENLVERDAGEIRELHLDDRPHPFHGRADRGADHRVFADRRVQDATGKLFRQDLSSP